MWYPGSLKVAEENTKTSISTLTRKKCKILCGFNETKPKLYVLPRISEIDDQVQKTKVS